MGPDESHQSIEERLCIQAAGQRIPINGIFELLPLCNLNCKMCYVRLSRQQMELQGGLHTAEEWLALAGQAQKAGLLFLLLTGGEPLLFPSFRHLYLELRKLGLILTINTNGTLIDEDWAAFFGRHKPRRINITLYGADSAAYGRLCGNETAFEKTLHAIRLLLAQGVAVKVNGSIAADNSSEGIRIIEICNKLGVPCKIDTYMYPGTRERQTLYDQQTRLTPEQAASVRVQLMRARSGKKDFQSEAQHMLDTIQQTQPDSKAPCNIECRAGTSSFAINWQGKMRPCIMVTEPEVPAFSQNFTAAWEQIVNKTTQIRLSARCSTCTMRRVCQTCAACALLETGQYDGTPKYMCRYTAETLRLLKKHVEEGKDVSTDGQIVSDW